MTTQGRIAPFDDASYDPFEVFAVRRGATKVTSLRVTVENFETATVGPGF